MVNRYYTIFLGEGRSIMLRRGLEHIQITRSNLPSRPNLLRIASAARRASESVRTDNLRAMTKRELFNSILHSMEIVYHHRYNHPGVRLNLNSSSLSSSSNSSSGSSSGRPSPRSHLSRSR